MERRYLKAIINNKTTRTNIINNTYILHHVHLFVALLSTDDFDDRPATHAPEKNKHINRCVHGIYGVESR